MARKSKNEIVIDSAYNASHQSHPILVAFMTLVVLGIIALAVWFFAYSQWGFSWSGNTARLFTEAPESVVTHYPSVDLTLSQPSVMLEPGQEARLSAKISRSKGSRDVPVDKVVLKWVSQNPRVASVDPNGRVKALDVGSATIMLTVANSDIDANPVYCLVTVRSWGNGPLDKEED